MCLLVTLACGAGVAHAAEATPGSTLLVSRPAGFGPAPLGFVNDSFGPAVSNDGRYIAFASKADGLSAAANNHVQNVYLRDRQSGDTTLVSRADGTGGAGGNGDSYEPAIAIDSNPPIAPLGVPHVLVAFDTDASNLGDHEAALSGATFTDSNGRRDVYMRDVTAGTTYVASVTDGTPGISATQGDDDALKPTIAVGSYGPIVAFFSLASNLGGTVPTVPEEIYTRTIEYNHTDLASCSPTHCSTAPQATNGFNPSLRVTSGGTVELAFATYSADISGDATNEQVVLASGPAGMGFRPTTFATLSRPDTSTSTLGNSGSYNPSLNSDGSRVAFEGAATNLTADTVSGSTSQVFVRDVGSPYHTVLASRAAGASGAVANADAYSASLAGDATHRKVAFVSTATNLGGAGGGSQTWVRDLDAATPTTTLLNRAGGAGGAAGDGRSDSAALSGDGSIAAFASAARNFGDEGDPDFTRVFARNLSTDALQLVSRPSGTAGTFRSGVSNSVLTPQAISADGRFVAFSSTSDDLLSPFADPRFFHVFVRDTLTGTTTLVGRADGASGAAANGDSIAVAISRDGRRVAFASAATNLVPGVTPTASEIYVRDLVAGTTTLASRAAGASGAVADQVESGGSLSADGSRVAFTTKSALDPAGANGHTHAYVRDLSAQTTTLVDRKTGAAGTVADHDALQVVLSGDGTKAAFITPARLDSAHTSSTYQAYVRDLGAATTTLVSRAEGAAGAVGNDSAFNPAADANGALIAFSSNATNLSADATGAHNSVFERDVAGGHTTLVSRASGASGADANADVVTPSIDAAGDRVAFSTSASNLSPEVTTPTWETYVRDLAASTTTLASRADGAAGAPADSPGLNFGDAISANGDCVAFGSRADNLLPGVTGTDFPRVFVRVLSRECPALPPVTTITSGPSGRTSERAPTFAFVSNEPGSTFACKIDGEGFAPCRSPHTVPALADGPHTFAVRATDPAGYVDANPPTRRFVVGAPSCKLKSAGSRVFVRAAKKHKGKQRPPQGVLKLTASCDRAARLKLTGKIRSVAKGKKGKKRPKAKTFQIAPLSASARANKSLMLTVKLPKAALSALKKGARESAAFTLRARNANGSSTATVSISKLVLVKTH